jgi:DNA-binding NarL/FixJ family response regulator
MLAGAGSFVAAPIVCHEQAVGLIHADRGLTGEAVTEVDRDTLAVFAEAFGQAVERCVLSGRLRAHSERVLALVRSTQESVTELGSAEFELRSMPGRLPAASVQLEGLHSLLTRRELEVVAMLAEGETNARIAQRLVVSEDTVKSHVKHILRKLGVHNRSQAVSRYFQARSGAQDDPLKEERSPVRRMRR